MTDIFISYKKEDVRRVEPIARALAQAGYEVWWDHNIPPGRTYRDVIGAALGSSKCVMVIWSTLSASAQWVLDEADEGKKRNVLLPLLIDDVEIPYGFRQIEAARLVDWAGDTSDPEWQNLLSSVAHFVGRDPGGPPRPFATPSARPSPRPVEAPRVQAQPSPQRSSALGPIIGVVAAAALVGGGAYAAWRAGWIGAPPTQELAEEGAAEEAAAGEEGAPAEGDATAGEAPVRQLVAVAGDPFQSYFASGYMFCDAKLVGDFWGQDIGETKMALGNKIINGYGEVIEEILQNARNAGHACDWTDTGYSYEDAEALAGVWSLETPYDAKLRVAALVTNGESWRVDRALGR